MSRRPNAVAVADHRPVLLAYIDESGNTGSVAAGGSLTYSLGCVLVDADEWPEAFDGLLAFRRRVRERFGVPMRAELKANYLIRGSGPLRPLGIAPAGCVFPYRSHMRAVAGLPARAFAVVVDKRADDRTPGGYFDLAWEGMLQRLERTSTYEQQSFMVVHDEGENDAVRKWVRRARRHLTAGNAFGGGGTVNPMRRLIDDPVSRRSEQSYFIQLADLVAYAGFRSWVAPSPSIAAVCPPSMWAELGTATHRKVNGLKPRGAPGVVIR